MKKSIWFDMDGTIVDLYGVDGWKTDLDNFNPRPYIVAKPLFDCSVLARALNKAIRLGYEINIISWLSRTTTNDYDWEVAESKRKWLKKHLPSVRFTHIDIVEYGTPKHIGRNGILFDDELKNRQGWGDGAMEPCEILPFLKLACTVN